MKFTSCPYCTQDTAGNHAWNCPSHTNSTPQPEYPEGVVELSPILCFECPKKEAQLTEKDTRIAELEGAIKNYMDVVLENEEDIANLEDERDRMREDNYKLRLAFQRLVQMEAISQRQLDGIEAELNQELDTTEQQSG